MKLYQDLNHELTPEFHGSKAHHLSLLSRQKFNVPKAFVLSKDVYSLYLENRESCLKDLRLETEAILKKLNSNKIMIRSSAIGEDGKNNSFAGVMDSFQSTANLEEVLDYIVKCWDSYQSKRAQDYQISSGTPLRGMAVIIQRMIDPIISGVTFTVSPLNEKDILIEYVEGHCERLVQGEVDPSKISLSRQGHQQLAAPFEELVLEARKIEAYFGFPQDIEWAHDTEGLWIIQARSITTINRKNLWSNTNVNENYPEKISPLLYSIAKESYYHFFQNLIVHLNAMKDTASVQYYLRNVVGLWGEKLYYNMTSVHHIIDQTPFSGLMKRSFDDFVGHRQSELKSSQKKFKQIFLFSFSVLKNLIKLPRLVKGIETEVDLFAETVDRSYSPQELKEAFHHFFHLRFNRWYQANIADFFAMIFHGLLGKMTRMLDKDQGVNWQNSLIQGIPGLISKKPVEEMWKIKLIIQSDVAFQHLFNSSPTDIWQALNQPRYQKLNLAIQAYLKDWGYRCSGELMLTMDNLAEKPETFITLMKAYHLTESRAPAEFFAQEKIKYAQTKKNILKILLKDLVKAPLKNTLLIVTFPLCWNLARYSISCRERVRLKQALMYSKFKTICLRLGDYLNRENVLAEANDIFFLDHEQIDRILSEDELNPSLIKEQIQSRKVVWEKAEVFPDEFHSYGLNNKRVDKVQNTILNTASRFYGLPASSGIMEGRAIVLKDIHEAHKLSKGDILITRQTDPGWISIFPLISGIVIERGGMLSHGAIVAREFGISAVVGVENATTLIKDGDLISINGNTGEVCLL